MSVAIRHDDLRKRNRAMVIAAVRRTGQPSRTEIAGSTGLSHSTISAISADLIAEGILIEIKGAEAATAKRGRPQVALGLAADAAEIVTVVLSLNYLSVAVVDYSGQLVSEEERKIDTLSMSREELIGLCVAMVRRQLEQRHAAGRKVLRIGMAVQGITDSASRMLLWSPITPHADIEFGDRLETATGIPVTVENDCNMIAVALRWRRPERYRNDFIAILLSHGIGMGMMLKGELFTGTQSSGGEFGHMIHRPDGALCRCGRRGCVEAYAGNYAIWRNAGLRSEDEAPLADISDEEIRDLADRARASDGPEREAFRVAGEAIGFGLGSLFALIDPAPVAVVGIGAAAFDLIEPPLRVAIDRTAGGQHNKAISFDTEPNERPLIREGCTMRALTFVDEELFAAGLAAADNPVSQSSRIA
ncbi:putative NBD/HSP70 family sugar kinase [Mesorhizobium soli]|uniref:ROK family protein n=1 Tax=Pseudaminobacter soli (ex Li et al. 2025) TaxID=1295366 RepID=UPI0024741B3D|nr:ROK family protein [Mesorhizobium soli]MDH6234177.1 putative NBD/HSP70 family sugar kinase [Mesorhizobium soli]